LDEALMDLRRISSVSSSSVSSSTSTTTNHTKKSENDDAKEVFHRLSAQNKALRELLTTPQLYLQAVGFLSSVLSVFLIFRRSISFLFFRLIHISVRSCFLSFFLSFASFCRSKRIVRPMWLWIFVMRPNAC
jgi:hypothetical protein